MADIEIDSTVEPVALARTVRASKRNGDYSAKNRGGLTAQQQAILVALVHRMPGESNADIAAKCKVKLPNFYHCLRTPKFIRAYQHALAIEFGGHKGKIAKVLIDLCGTEGKHQMAAIRLFFELCGDLKSTSLSVNIGVNQGSGNGGFNAGDGGDPDLIAVQSEKIMTLSKLSVETRLAIVRDLESSGAEYIELEPAQVDD